MDPAVIGSCRIDYCRVDVFDPIFDDLISQMEGQAPIGDVITPPYEYPYGEWDITDWDNCVWE